MALEQTVSSLRDEYTKLNDKLLYEDTETVQIQIRERLEAIDTEICKLNEQINKQKQQQVDEFTNRMNSVREKQTKSHQDQIYNIAKQDAENTITRVLCLSHEELTEIFPNATKLIHKWHLDLYSNKYNQIPLGPGIEIPKMKDRATGKIKDVYFTVSRFLNDPLFIRKCQDYYHQRGISMNIELEKNTKRWWITLEIYGKK